MYQKLFFDVLEVSIDEVEERMYIRKKVVRKSAQRKRKFLMVRRAV